MTLKNCVSLKWVCFHGDYGSLYLLYVATNLQHPTTLWINSIHSALWGGG